MSVVLLAPRVIGLARRLYLEAVAGASNAGVENLTAYAFSTENWKRSTEEVKFLMGYNKDVLRRRRDLLMEWNVRIRWSGSERRLWPSVVRELRVAEEMTKNNTGLVLTMAVNYGGTAGDSCRGEQDSPRGQR